MNQSKKRDLRAWRRWDRSGAVGRPITDQELSDWKKYQEARDQSTLAKLKYLISRVTSDVDVFPDGNGPTDVLRMTRFQQIKFLQALAENNDYAWHNPELSRWVSLFAEEMEGEEKVA